MKENQSQEACLWVVVGCLFRAEVFIIIIYLFWAALGLHCCTRAFSSCGKWGLLFIALHGFLTVMISLVLEHKFSSWVTQAQLSLGIWDLPGLGIKPVYPALADGLTTGPLGKSQNWEVETDGEVEYKSEKD